MNQSLSPNIQDIISMKSVGLLVNSSKPQQENNPSLKASDSSILTHHITIPLAFSLTCLITGFLFGWHTGDKSWTIGLWGGLLGIAVGSSILGIEWLTSRTPFSTIVHTTQSLTIGLVLALIFSCVMHLILPISSSIAPALSLVSLLSFSYLSYAIRRNALHQTGQREEIQRSAASTQQTKILDTSSIIDGRIFDLCETGFMEGPLCIPRFVLEEIHTIADSHHSWRRVRGKRGLEILANLQNIPTINTHITEEDFPTIPEVDNKLVMLAKHLQAKIVTNDWNLGKVASLQGVQILNVNQLSYQLKPPVLPGEVIRVLIIKEGDLEGQGVAHLDDGTMVVVDQARDYIKETIDVIITKFMQTHSGRILFGARL